MPPPLPWDICCQPKALFQNEELFIEVPNTAYVKVENYYSFNFSFFCKNYFFRAVIDVTVLET